MRLISAACAFVLALSSVHADVDPALREDGVLYLEDNLPARVVGTVKTPTTVYLHRDFQMPLASLFAGQKIEIVGQGPEGYIVAATYRNNSVSGWIMSNDLPPDVDPAQFAQARKNQEHRAMIAAAIANKQVLRGMTQDEVHQVLGDPDQTSTHTDDQGTSQTWTFTAYQDVLQTVYAPGLYGRPTLQTVSTRVQVGQKIVTFENGLVVAIEEHKTDPATAAANANAPN